MSTILDHEDTVEAQALSTSLDPYGQLIKMLMPRALCIAIYDRMGVPLWQSDGCDGTDLLHAPHGRAAFCCNVDPLHYTVHPACSLR